MDETQPSATPEGTPAESGNPQPAATETEQPTPSPEPKAEETKPDTDWRKAFESLQKADSRKARRLEELQQGNSALAEALTIVRKQQEATLRATLPTEQADKILAESAATEASLRQRSSIDKAAEVLKTQQLILTNTMEQFGIDPKQVDWANDAQNIEEYQERVLASINTHIGKAREDLLKGVKRAVETNSKAEKSRLEDEKRRELKAAGVDKIDTASGAPSTFLTRLATMDPNSKEFADLTKQALEGRLRGVR